MAATALWLGAKLEEVPEVSQHPEKLVRKVLVTVDRICSRREDAKPSLLEPTQKVGARARFLCVDLRIRTVAHAAVCVCVCARARARARAHACACACVCTRARTNLFAPERLQLPNRITL